MQDYDPTPAIHTHDEYLVWLSKQPKVNFDPDEIDSDKCRLCGNTEWDGECLWCEPNDEDDDSSEQAREDDDRAEAYEQDREDHYSGGY